ncbi:MAG: DUF72 domain-containing protein [Candidatus Solibacter usitatus]|nr:DUF72 domain-containing protein [Candidatus Solibacter usitatus]
MMEIGSSREQMVRPELARMWLQLVAHKQDFRFTSRLPYSFTHEGKLDAESLKRFHEGLRPLMESGKLGCLVMEFPWACRFTKENREFFIKLRRLFSDYPLVAEMRHESWQSEEALGTFIDYHVGFANIDQPQYVKAMPPTAFLTSSVGYVHLYGRSPANWNPAGRPKGSDYLYSPFELAEWKQRVDRLRAFASNLFIIAGNDAGGRSVVNMMQFQSMLAGQAPAIAQQPHGGGRRAAAA